MQNATDDIELISPTAEDGYDLNVLIGQSPPLDPNSVYCNLLQCSHFSGTSIGAKKGGELVGFISGYLIPSRPDTLFVWQVVVSEKARGQGLASRMLRGLLEQTSCMDVNYLETTITPDNPASQALFKRLADRMGCPLEVSEGFDRETHFKGHHESEELYRIGPFNAERNKDLT